MVVVVVLLFLLLSSARFYTDFLWFQEVGLASVLWTSLSAEFAVGAVVGLLVAVMLWLNLFVAARLAPTYRVAVAADPRFDPFERYREILLPYAGRLRLAIAAAIGFLAGGAASDQWQTFLLWRNGVDFGIEDPQFGRDVGFYVFDLPFLETVFGWLTFVVGASIVLSVAAHYFYGSIRMLPSMRGISPGALAHVSVLLGLLALVRAGRYWLGQYQLNFSARGVVTGASYTDVHAQLPALKLLALISIVSAILFIVNIQFRRASLPIAAVGIWILTAFLAGGVWPWWVQRFSVEPQELEREQRFIERNIDATREAFGLTDVTTRSFAAGSVTPEQAAANQALLNNVRVWDPDVLQRAYEQLQAIRLYYRFQDVDIDRYLVDGEMRQVLLAGREMSLDDLDEKSKTWSNLHLQFTHGYGMVASLANEATSSGQPQFLIRDVPGTVRTGAEVLDLERPEIYFGESFEDDEYSIVNSKQDELDYPTEEGVQRSNYAGRGGIALSSLFKRIAFAIREGDTNLVLSSLIEPESRILVYRDIRDRVRRAAPFLALDHDPYLAAVDGHLAWVLDAYTTTSSYPYAQRFDIDEVLDAQEEGMLEGSVNYVRNSVKVTVDAYDGDMTFFVIDDSDPLIAAWSKVFPDLFTHEDPPDSLVAHFRYPEDLFDVQSEVYLTYHMTDPADFYAKEDAWSLPVDPKAGATGGDLPATYLLAQLPGSTDQEFLLTRPATPRGKNNMLAVMVGRSDPGVYGEFLALQFPRQRQVPGPIQVDNLINQDVEISRTLTLLSQQGSRVEFGSLVVLPLDDGIMYVQPIFVTAQNVGIPELKKVAIVSGDDVVMEDSLDEALLELFGAPEEPVVEPPDEDGDRPAGDDEPAAEPELAELVAQAVRVYDQAQAALARGDFEEYGKLIERLGRLLQAAEAAGERARAGT